MVVPVPRAWPSTMPWMSSRRAVPTSHAPGWEHVPAVGFGALGRGGTLIFRRDRVPIFNTPGKAGADFKNNWGVEGAHLILIMQHTSLIRI